MGAAAFMANSQKPNSIKPGDIADTIGVGVPVSVQRKSLLEEHLHGGTQVRKQTPEKQAGEYLRDVQGDVRFWCSNGEVYGSLMDLEKGLRAMTADAFAYHCAGGRNDFAEWVRSTIGDDFLANEMSQCKTRLRMVQSVSHRVSWLRSHRHML